ncbi:hypothetical protein Y1Q_0013775 [Alligator mississippiensis]|uniref:Uncharacterized protein n=1 Tax=Alligator mississippiensis TaxID=8496 RepID=A0A151MM71_ALLMI|nr:hypothetical protein Y1Q_0013775 [Alligator mississippiensis]
MLGWHGGSGCKPHTLRQHGKGPLIEEKALIGNQVVPRGSKHQTMHALGEWAPAPAQFIQGSMHSSQGRKWLRENTHLEEKGSRQAEK